jgi:hypothetical protein
MRVLVHTKETSRLPSNKSKEGGERKRKQKEETNINHHPSSTTSVIVPNALTLE